MKNLGLFQFVLASCLAMFVTFPAVQVEMPASDVEEGKTTFEKFLAKFPQANLPYSIDMEALALEELESTDMPERDEASLLGDEFGTILPAIEHRRFSRMGPDDFHAEALLVSNDDFHILLYSRKLPFSFYPGTYKLAVFSRSGEQLDEISFAYSYGRDGGMTGHINKDLVVEIAEEKSVWAKDVRKYGYEDNEIVDYETITSDFFTIDKNGMFEKMDIKKLQPEENVAVEGDAE